MARLSGRTDITRVQVTDSTEREDIHHESPGDRLQHRVSDQKLYIEEDHCYGDQRLPDSHAAALLQVILKVKNLVSVLKATLMIYK